MPDDILAELFFGKIVPWENGPRNKDSARRLNQEMAQLWKSIEEKAGSEVLELLEKYLALRSDMSMGLQCDCFKSGFRLGMKILMATIVEEELQ